MVYHQLLEYRREGNFFWSIAKGSTLVAHLTVFLCGSPIMCTTLWRSCAVAPYKSGSAPQLLSSQLATPGGTTQLLGSSGTLKIVILLSAFEISGYPRLPGFLLDDQIY